MDSYDKWTIPKIKEELHKRGAKVTGRKQELIQRLIFYDQNNNSVTTNENESQSYKIIVPDNGLFKDLHSGINLPLKITRTDIKLFLKNFDQRILPKAMALHESKFVQYIKYYRHGNKYFFKSGCRAAMKKVLYYIVIIMGTYSEILETECECPAGMGPYAHCKHVAAVLLVISQFTLTKEIMVAECSTEVLQTFHKPKGKFNRSPIPIRLMKYKNNRHRLPGNKYDPRPVHLKNLPWYKDYFRNICINSTIKDYPMLHLYAPACPYGIENDHSYCKISIIDNLFQAMELQNVTDYQIAEIEEATRGQSKSNRWHLERSFRITSTVLKDIVKATDRRNRQLLCRQILFKEQIYGKAIIHGMRNEEAAIRKYFEKYGIQVQRCGTFVIKESPYLCATPDGLIEDDGVIEVKCPYTARNRLIDPVTVPYLTEEQNESGLKMYTLKRNHTYYYQIMGQLWATNRSFCDFIIYTYCDFLVIKIKNIITKIIKHN